MPSDELFQDRLATLMKERKLSQAAIAKAMGIGQSTVSGWLNGAVPQPRMLRELSFHLAVPLSWLLEGRGPKELSELEMALLPSKLAGGQSVEEAAHDPRAQAVAKVMLQPVAMGQWEWDELINLRQDIIWRLVRVITNPDPDGEPQQLLLEKIGKYLTFCTRLKPDTAFAFKEALTRLTHQQLSPTPP